MRFSFVSHCIPGRRHEVKSKTGLKGRPGPLTSSEAIFVQLCSYSIFGIRPNALYLSTWPHVLSLYRMIQCHSWHNSFVRISKDVAETQLISDQQHHCRDGGDKKGEKGTRPQNCLRTTWTSANGAEQPGQEHDHLNQREEVEYSSRWPSVCLFARWVWVSFLTLGHGMCCMQLPSKTLLVLLCFCVGISHVLEAHYLQVAQIFFTKHKEDLKVNYIVMYTC